MGIRSGSLKSGVSVTEIVDYFRTLFVARNGHDIASRSRADKKISMNEFMTI